MARLATPNTQRLPILGHYGASFCEAILSSLTRMIEFGLYRTGRKQESWRVVAALLIADGAKFKAISLLI